MGNPVARQGMPIDTDGYATELPEEHRGTGLPSRYRYGREHYRLPFIDQPYIPKAAY